MLFCHVLCAMLCVQVEAVEGLSVLELCMLVAAQRLEDAGSCVFNFQVCALAESMVPMCWQTSCTCCLKRSELLAFA
jgi:hypothetical protein